MICVSLCSGTASRVLSVMRRVEMAELRLDLLDLGVRDLVKVFKTGGCRTIATCRPGAYDDAERTAILAAAIESGADYVDIELEAPAELAGPVLTLARRKKCRVIVSYHDLDSTPDARTLRQKLNNCFQKGADIAKIACMVKEPMDNLRLLRLLEGDRPVVVVGMGEQGKMTRISAPLLGAPFTYASWARGEETAPGQLTYREMKAVYRKMGAELR